MVLSPLHFNYSRLSNYYDFFILFMKTKKESFSRLGSKTNTNNSGCCFLNVEEKLKNILLFFFFFLQNSTWHYKWWFKWEYSLIEMRLCHQISEKQGGKSQVSCIFKHYWFGDKFSSRNKIYPLNFWICTIFLSVSRNRHTHIKENNRVLKKA